MDVSNLVSGVIGAVLGVAGAFLIQFHDRRRREKGAGRALFFELIQNANAGEAAATAKGFRGAWSVATWQAVQADVANYLDAATFGAIAWAYRCIDMASTVEAEHGTGSAEHRSLSAVPQVAFERAVYLLGPKVWNADQIEALTSQIQKPVIG